MTAYEAFEIGIAAIINERVDSPNTRQIGRIVLREYCAFTPGPYNPTNQKFYDFVKHVQHITKTAVHLN